MKCLIVFSFIENAFDLMSRLNGFYNCAQFTARNVGKTK